MINSFYKEIPFSLHSKGIYPSIHNPSTKSNAIIHTNHITHQISPATFPYEVGLGFICRFHQHRIPPHFKTNQDIVPTYPALATSHGNIDEPTGVDGALVSSALGGLGLLGLVDLGGCALDLAYCRNTSVTGMTIYTSGLSCAGTKQRGKTYRHGQAIRGLYPFCWRMEESVEVRFCRGR